MSNGSNWEKVLECMREVGEAIAKLDGDQEGIGQVLMWANRQFGRARDGIVSTAIGRPSDEPRDTPVSGVGGTHASLADLFAAANPQSSSEMALVAAYWLQHSEQITELDAQRINSELTHLGHRLLNVTRTLDNLKNARPALVVQTRKEGSTKQARKRYKLTVAGIKAVENMLMANIGAE